MIISIKPGARVLGLKPEINIAVTVAASIFTELGKDMTITAGTDGQHKEGSMHNAGWAVDLRTRHLSESEETLVAAQLQKNLGSGYDVVVHGSHIHVEYDPRKQQ